MEENRLRLEPLDVPMADEEEGDEPKGFPRELWGKGKVKAKETDTEANPLLDEDMDDDEEHPLPPPEEEPPPKPSKTYEIVQRITRPSQHYLTHGSFIMRAKVLRLVSQATSTLGINEREYLPLINDIWPVIYTRLFDDEPGVVMQAYQAITGIAETAGDFMATRVKEGWPGLRKVYAQAWGNLEKERRVNSASPNMGIYGVNYKVWDAMVMMLTALVKHAGVYDEILNEICEMCGRVLAERKDLREALEEAGSADAVWLEMESWERKTDWMEKMPVLKGGSVCAASVLATRDREIDSETAAMMAANLCICYRNNLTTNRSSSLLLLPHFFGDPHYSSTHQKRFFPEVRYFRWAPG
jgi:hypothetical protein